MSLPACRARSRDTHSVPHGPTRIPMVALNDSVERESLLRKSTQDRRLSAAYTRRVHDVLRGGLGQRPRVDSARHCSVRPQVGTLHESAHLLSSVYPHLQRRLCDGSLKPLGFYAAINCLPGNVRVMIQTGPGAFDKPGAACYRYSRQNCHSKNAAPVELTTWRALPSLEPRAKPTTL